MKFTKFATLAVATSTLALAACGDTADNETMTEDTVVEETAMAEEDGMPVGGELNEQQQANMDAMDSQAVSDEYDANRDAMMSGGSDMSGDDMSSDNMSGDNMSGGGDMADSSGSAMNLPSRTNMSYSFLDRNGDGQLSTAEYAIWAVRANPGTDVQNDNTRPYISPDQINEAAQTFFYFDEDGNTYLSESEFQAARDSSRAPSTM